MSKKIITLLLAASMMTAALASCGGNNDGEDTTADTTVAEDTTDEAAPETSVSIEDLAAAIKGEFGDLYDPANEMGLPLSEYRANFAADTFELKMPGFESISEEDLGMPISEYITSELVNIYGIQTEWAEDVLLQKAASITSVDAFMIVKPTDGNKENVVSALEAYKEYSLNDAFQYPTNLPKIRAAKIVEQGDYVFFLMVGSIPDELLYAEIDYENLSEDEIAAEQARIDSEQENAAADNNQKAIDAIAALLG
ncbi:MAG: DUF4358 domain-containing protein [Clostridia bacterium]|nr:DUF4358 domain-containing protein [Clostridia bacterium]